MIQYLKKLFTTKTLLVPMRPVNAWNEGHASALKAFLATDSGRAFIEQLEGAEAAAYAWACNSEGDSSWKMGVGKGRSMTRLHILSMSTVTKLPEPDYHDLTEAEQNAILEETISNRIANGSKFLL